MAKKSNQLYHIGPLLTVLITGSLCHAVVEKHELLCTVVDALLEKLWLPAYTQIGAGGAGCGRGWVWTDIYQVTVCGVTRLKRADESSGECLPSVALSPPGQSLLRSRTEHRSSCPASTWPGPLRLSPFFRSCSQVRSLDFFSTRTNPAMSAGRGRTTSDSSKWNAQISLVSSRL